MQDFGRILDGVQDPRTGNATRHNLHEMPMIALPCVLCGGRACTDLKIFGCPEEAFLRRFIEPGYGIPGHDAFPDLFRIPGPEGLQRAPVRLAADWSGRLGPEVTAVGGKALRRSSRDASKRSPLHVVNAFAAGARLTLGQVRVDGRPEGITAMPKLPGLPDVRGMTADAMHGWRDTARQDTEAGGDHLLALKGNQETLHDEVRIHLADPENAERMQLSDDVDKGHGRTGDPRGDRPPRRRRPAGPASLALPADRREGHGDTGDQGGGAEHGDPLFPLRRKARAGTVPDDGAPAPGGGEFAAPGPGRDHGGGRPPQPEGQRPGHPADDAEAGVGPGADSRWRKGDVGVREAEEDRMGRRLTAETSRFRSSLSGECGTQRNPNTIALATDPAAESSLDTAIQINQNIK